jgi:hypothetical protein
MLFYFLYYILTHLYTFIILKFKIIGFLLLKVILDLIVIITISRPSLITINYIRIKGHYMK